MHILRYQEISNAAFLISHLPLKNPDHVRLKIGYELCIEPTFALPYWIDANFDHRLKMLGSSSSLYKPLPYTFQESVYRVGDVLKHPET
jgi:hypothetical protein